MSDQQAKQAAEKRAKAKYEFYIHLSVYILVNALLVAINLSTQHKSYWFIWPLTGWGIGVFFHALGVFVLPNRTSLKDKLVEREMRKQK